VKCTEIVGCHLEGKECKFAQVGVFFGLSQFVVSGAGVVL